MRAGGDIFGFATMGVLYQISLFTADSLCIINGGFSPKHQAVSIETVMDGNTTTTQVNVVVILRIDQLTGRPYGGLYRHQDEYAPGKHRRRGGSQRVLHRQAWGT